MSLPGNDRRRTNRTWSSRFAFAVRAATTDDAPVDIEHEMPTPASEHNPPEAPLTGDEPGGLNLGMRLRHS